MGGVVKLPDLRDGEDKLFVSTEISLLGYTTRQNLFLVAVSLYLSMEAACLLF